jgi:hypothetical protein
MHWLACGLSLVYKSEVGYVDTSWLEVYFGPEKLYGTVRDDGTVDQEPLSILVRAQHPPGIQRCNSCGSNDDTYPSLLRHRSNTSPACTGAR